MPFSDLDSRGATLADKKTGIYNEWGTTVFRGTADFRGVDYFGLAEIRGVKIFENCLSAIKILSAMVVRGTVKCVPRVTG